MQTFALETKKAVLLSKDTVSTLRERRAGAGWRSGEARWMGDGAAPHLSAHGHHSLGVLGLRAELRVLHPLPVHLKLGQGLKGATGTDGFP